MLDVDTFLTALYFAAMVEEGTHDEQDHLLSYDGTTYEYTEAGDLTTKTDSQRCSQGLSL